MKLTKIIALAVLGAGLAVAAQADTFFHLKVDIGNWRLGIGSTQHYCPPPVVYVPEYRRVDWRRDEWRRDEHWHDRDRDWHRDRR